MAETRALLTDAPQTTARAISTAGIVTLAAVLLFQAFIDGTRKWFTYDEIVSRALALSDSTAALVAWSASGVDSNPPLFALLLRGFIAVTSSSEVALALFAGLGATTACVAFFVTVSRRLDPVSAGVGLTFGMLTASHFYIRLGEARPYSWLLAILTLLCASALTTWTARWRVVVAQTLLGASAFWIHPLGGVAALIILAATVTTLRWREARWTMLAGALGAVSFTPWLPSVARQSEIFFGSRSQPQPPLLSIVTLVGPDMAGIVVIMVVIAASLWLRRGGLETPARDNRSGDVALRVGVGLALLYPSSLWTLHGLGILPLVALRYYFPCLLGWSLLGAVVVRCAGAERLPAWTGIVVCCLAATVCGGYWMTPVRPRPLDGIEAFAPGAPIFFEHSEDFFPVRFYSPEASRMYLVIDLTEAMGEASVWDAQLEYHLMLAFQNKMPSNIVELAEARQRFKTIYLVNDQRRSAGDRLAQGHPTVELDDINIYRVDLTTRLPPSPP